MPLVFLRSGAESHNCLKVTDQIKILVPSHEWKIFACPSPCMYLCHQITIHDGCRKPPPVSSQIFLTCTTPKYRLRSSIDHRRIRHKKSSNFSPKFFRKFYNSVLQLRSSTSPSSTLTFTLFHFSNANCIPANQTSTSNRSPEMHIIIASKQLLRR